MTDLINILLVEDTPSDIRLTQEALKRSGLEYELAVANDGEEAMEYLSKSKTGANKRPDIILLDLNMPKKNGHEVLQEIQADSDVSTIPVILLTVSKRDEDVMEALKLKMNYYIAKPVSAQNLTSIVKSIYELKEGKAQTSQADADVHVRVVLAGNPHTIPSILTRLAEDENPRVRRRLAENPNCPPSIMLKLAGDAHPDVRLGLAENENLPEDILLKLAKDPSDDVRLGLSENRKLSLKILKSLADDENIFVATKANETISALAGSKD